LQKAVLANPVVYASEGFRATLVPALPHLPPAAILGGLIFFDFLFIVLGLIQFRRKAIS